MCAKSSSEHGSTWTHSSWILQATRLRIHTASSECLRTTSPRSQVERASPGEHQVDAPPAPTLAVIAGGLHNLRSALDHLAWALVLENGGEPGDTDPKTQFPIFLNPPKSKTGQPKQVTIRAKDGGPSLAATTILEMLQPYNGGHEANSPPPLWLLRCLSNIDKHQTLTVTALDLGRIVMRSPNGRTTYAVRRDVEDGTMVMWILEEAEDFDREIEGEAHFTPSVEFRDARGIGMQPFLPASDLLAKLLEFTRDSVIQRFARSCFGGELSIS